MILWVTTEFTVMPPPPPPQKWCLLTVATRMPLWESFLSYRTLTAFFCLVRQREMRTVLFVFYHQGLQVDVRIRSA